MVPSYGKNIRASGKLWGYSDTKAEADFVQRIKSDFYRVYGDEEKSTKCIVAYSQLIEYPEDGLQCIQTETWVKL